MSALRRYIERGLPGGQAEALAELDALEQRAADTKTIDGEPCHVFRVAISDRILRMAPTVQLVDIGRNQFAKELLVVLERMTHQQREARVALRRELDEAGMQPSQAIAHQPTAEPRRALDGEQPGAAGGRDE